MLFLKSFSYRTQIFEQGNAADFVRELSTRYLVRHPPVSNAGAKSASEPAPVPATPGSEMKPGSVFPAMPARMPPR